ncbi:hypothetical protein SGCOL_006949 [Colletotrichum sp. CLE4]
MPLTIDTVAVFLRGTILNPALVAAVAGIATLSLDQAALTSYNVPFTLSQLQLASCALAAGGLTLRLHEYLTRWTANNWTTDTTWDWSKEIVVVTGASGEIGIGAGIVRDLLARNPHTTIVVVDYVPLAWQPSPGTGKNLHYYQCDLSDKDNIRTLCQRIRAEVGNPTVLVNNAGLGRGRTVMEGAYADVELTINTNLLAPFLLTKEFLPHMVRENHGHIVNVSSMSSVMPPAQIADYAATKAGLAALHESLQLELKYIHNAPKVRLTLGLLSFIKTAMFKGETGQSAFVFPLLEPDAVARAFTDALYSGLGRVIYLPGMMRCIAMLRSSPEWFWRIARESTAGLKVDFQGYQKVDSKTGKLEILDGKK